MKTRQVVIASVLGLVLLTVGLVGAVAASSSSTSDGSTQATLAVTGMHDTPAMERMHAAMPTALQAKCDAVHARMAGMMDGGMMDGGMMDGGMMDGGMMDGGMMGAASSAELEGTNAHHSTDMMG